MTKQPRPSDSLLTQGYLNLFLASMHAGNVLSSEIIHDRNTELVNNNITVTFEYLDYHALLKILSAGF